MAQQLLLDPSSYAVTGQRTLSDGSWPSPAGGNHTIPRGQVVSSLAWAKIVRVGRPGQR